MRESYDTGDVELMQDMTTMWLVNSLCLLVFTSLGIVTLPLIRLNSITLTVLFGAIAWHNRGGMTHLPEIMASLRNPDLAAFRRRIALIGLAHGASFLVPLIAIATASIALI